MDSIGSVLSSVYTDSSLKHVIEVLDSDSLVRTNGRNVRSLTEQKLLSTSSSMLTQMKPLATNLNNLQTLVAKQRKTYDEMAQLSTNSQSATAVYSAEAHFIEKEREKIAAHINTLTAFMDRVHVSAEEKELLTDSSSALTEEFLTAFNRVRLIHSESAQVMLAEMPGAGELLMLETSKILDQAYTKVKTAIEIEMKKKNSNESDGHIGLRSYMSLLSDRPLLFKSVLENQSGTRKQKLSRDFSLFLATEKGNSTAFPVRFMGSILAWIHAAIVNEIENISLLLNPTDKQEQPFGNIESSNPSSETQRDQMEQLLNTTNPHEIVSELVDEVVGSLEPSLKQNMNALILAQTDASIIDEIQNLLKFYQHSVLARYEQPTITSLFDQVDAGLNNQFQRLLPGEWEDCVELAHKLLKIRDNSVFVDDKAVTARLDLVLDSKLDTALKSGNEIMALNTLNFAISRLAGFLSIQTKLDKFKSIENEYVSKLVASEVAILKTQSKIDLLQLNALSWREFTINMDQFLLNSGQELVGRLDALSSPNLAHRITNLIVDEFISEYETATKDHENARPAEEVRSLME